MTGDLLPRITALLGAPGPVARTLVRLAVLAVAVAPGWAQVRADLIDVSGCDDEEADRLILEAIRNGEAQARLSDEDDGLDATWHLRVTYSAGRAILLDYAISRLDQAGIDPEDAHALYRHDDADLVLPFVVELLRFRDGQNPEPRFDVYRRLLR